MDERERDEFREPSEREREREREREIEIKKVVKQLGL